MKILKQIVFLLSAVLLFASCSNDGEKLTTAFNAVVAGSTSDESIVLKVENSSDLALSLYWTDNGTLTLSDTSYRARNYAITNTVQFSASRDFSGTLRNEQMEDGVYSYQYTVKQLNTIVLALGFEKDVSAPLYIRIKSVIGNNMEPLYSSVIIVNVTAYVIDMSKVSMRSTNSEQTILAKLTSANEDGEYEGFAVTKGTWQNFYFVENDGTVWGNNSEEGTPFLLSDKSTMWSCWFPETKGCHYVYMSRAAKHWSAINIPEMTASEEGKEMAMTFDSDDHLWGVVITTANDNETVNISGTGKLYDINTGTDNDAAKDFPFSLGLGADGSVSFVKGSGATGLSIPSAGTYTLFIYLDGSNYVLKDGEQSIGGGDDKWPADNDYAVPSSQWMYIVDKDDNSIVKTSLYSSSSDAKYTGFYNASEWENFMFSDASDGTGKIYGSAPVDNTGLYRLYCSSDKWNIWFDAGGYFYIEANFNDSSRSWSKTAITSISVLGDFNEWSLTSDVMTYDSSSKLWTATCNPSSWGTYGIKFIINGDWNWAYTDSNSDGILEPGTTEFMPSIAAGSCTITLDLNDPSQLKYTITAN
ncbi:MAG: DUF5114 domain-containing protein [Bacteroidales bacterium]|jgi:hypothetical protein|nr:DUF5114 domain-containing protein [Bacteroidales bacterium]